MSRLTVRAFIELVGSEDLAEAIMRAVGGRRVPRLTKFHVKRRRRAERVRRLVDRGGYKEAAAQAGISVRHAKRLSKEPGRPRQPLKPGAL